MAWSAVWAVLATAGPAQAGLETFDGTGLAGGWVAAGSFTGQQEVVWTYAHARGVPTVYSNNPSISLQTGSSTSKGWLASAVLTGGTVRISAAFKQELSDPVDCDIWAGGLLVGNHVSGGIQGEVEVASFDVLNPVTRLPVTNDFVLVVSNRLASGGRLGLDNLAWDPFRLFVRLDRTGTNSVFAGSEFDVQAEVFDIGQGWTGGWEIPAGFAGTVSDTNELHLTVIPAAADIGQVHALTFTAVEEGGEGATHSARFHLEVLEAPDPRLVDFEGASFAYNTNDGVEVHLNGMNWKFINVSTGDTTDRRLGATSGRFRHQTAAAACMESLEPFDGIGTVSMHFAHYGNDRTVLFAVQVRAIDEEEWTTLPDGTFNVQGHDDITNSVFAVDVLRAEELYFRLITTGNAEQIANLDDIRIRAYGDTLPFLDWSGPVRMPVGWESALEFSVRHRDGTARTWTSLLAPENANGVFEVTPEDRLRFRFSPQSTNEWGDYTVQVGAKIDGEWSAETSVTVRVVSPPVFDLVPVATNIVVPGVVDVVVANVVLHGTNLTQWTTEWTAQPLFVNPPSVSHKSWFRIGTGTREADAGDHWLTARLTDSGTGVTATNAVLLTVVSAGGGGITGEVYAIHAFDITNRVEVNGHPGRVYQVFGTTNLNLGAGEGDWTWQGPVFTNLDGADVQMDLPNTPHPRLFFYGVRIREAP